MGNEAAASSGFSSILEGNKLDLAKIKDFENSPITAKARNLAFMAFIGISLIFAFMFAVQIIQGVLALILVVVFAASAFFGLRFLKTMDPLIRQKTKNFQLKAMYDEARKNAVLQLDNQVITNHARLGRGRKARDKVKAMMSKMEMDVDKTDTASSFYNQKKKMLDKVSSAYTIIADNIDKGGQANKVFERKVEEYKDMDRFAKMANEAMGALNSAGDAKLNKMLSLEAFAAIEGDFNGALATIENTARDMQVDSEDA